MTFRALLVASLLAVSVQSASAAPIVDYSGLAVNDSANGFGNVGGVQFLNPTAFLLDSVQILLGLTSPGTATFHVFQFDSGMGDTTGTLIGSVNNVAVQGLDFTSFAAKSTTIDVSSLNLNLQAGTVYGFALEGENVRGGSTGGALSTSANIGTIYNGDLAGNFFSLQQYEIPFIAYSKEQSVPEPASLLLLGAGVAAVVRRRSRARR